MRTNRYCARVYIRKRNSSPSLSDRMTSSHAYNKTCNKMIFERKLTDFVTINVNHAVNFYAVNLKTQSFVNHSNIGTMETHGRLYNFNFPKAIAPGRFKYDCAQGSLSQYRTLDFIRLFIWRVLFQRRNIVRIIRVIFTRIHLIRVCLTWYCKLVWLSRAARCYKPILVIVARTPYSGHTDNRIVDLSLRSLSCHIGSRRVRKFKDDATPDDRI